ncbi:MAG: HEPN domain-containing protein [Candidatus Edwardsbacteria bacterium]
MTNSREYERWLKDAEACLNAMKRDRNAGDFRATIEFAQHVVELCAKAVIACFAEPDWTHNPEEQILRILKENGEKIEKTFGNVMLQRLKTLAADVKEIAPWHGRAVYGQEIKPQVWISAVDACTKEKAEWASALAERSFKTVKNFTQKWFDKKC